MKYTTLLSIPVGTLSQKNILEKIKKHIHTNDSFLHVVSLNPEHVLLALREDLLKQILLERSIIINDGVGIRLACRVLGIACAKRITGVDLMIQLIGYAGEAGLCVLLLGSNVGLADKLAKRYQERFPHAHFVGLEGYRDIKSPTQHEEEIVSGLISEVKPDLVFVAFGAPWQEYWIDSHRKILQHSVCMGVGGSFDFISGEIVRAPAAMRRIGLEWLFRLVRQPWRWYRQTALIHFIYLVILEKLKPSRE